MSYKVNVSRQVLRDIQDAVFYKKQLGTYARNIDNFVRELDELIYSRLCDSPMVSASLSSRVDVETSIRYQVVNDYILFYDVVGAETVNVLRLLSARSDWATVILKSI